MLTEHALGGTGRKWSELSARASFWLAIGAFVLVLAGGRWASYLSTPHPLVHLPDLLLGAAAVLSLPAIWALRELPLAVQLSAAATFAFIGVTLVAFMLEPADRPLELFVRDFAPFLYLGVAWILMAGMSVIPRDDLILRILRAGTLLHVILLALTWAAFINPTPWNFTEPALMFSYREDFTGVVLGLGVLVWGSWSDRIEAHRTVQWLFIVGGLSLQNRTGFAVFAALAVLSWVRERACLPWRKAVPALILAVAASAMVSLWAPGNVPVAPTSDGGTVRQAFPALGRSLSLLESRELLLKAGQGDSPASTVGSPPNSPSIAETGPGEAAFQTEAGVAGFATGTALGRVQTWRLLAGYLVSEGAWFSGAGPGSTAMEEACSGICPVAGPVTNLRSPHNFPLFLVLYSGILGLAVFAFAVGAVLTYSRRVPFWLPVAVTVMSVLSVGLLGVVVETPFGMIPIAFCVAWLGSRLIRSGVLEPRPEKGPSGTAYRRAPTACPSAARESARTESPSGLNEERA